jgi:hypothetical protein
MSYGITLVFEGVGEAQYWAVNDKLGVARDGSGDWPDGMLHHLAGPAAGGGWVVMERWESKAHQERFMGDRLGAALGAVGLPAPASVIETTAINEFLPS